MVVLKEVIHFSGFPSQQKKDAPKSYEQVKKELDQSDLLPTTISEKSLELINSGDDYELCFTVDEDKHEELMNVSKILNIPITLIGKTSSSKDLILYLFGLCTWGLRPPGAPAPAAR